MTIRITTTRAALALGLALVYMGLAPATSAAADREHQQIMADLRMLQEQTQQLQALMNGLGEALKAVNSRLEDQTALERKAFADGKVQMDSLSGDIRIVREKVDETNVRLGSISQELESIRQAIPEPGMVPVPVAPPSTDAAVPGAPGAAGVPAPQAAAMPPAQPNPGIQPQRLFASSYGDYTAGNYSLAVQGFQSYLQYFPEEPAGPRSPALHRRVALAGQERRRGGRGLRSRDRTTIRHRAPSRRRTTSAASRCSASATTTERRESFEAVIKQFPDSQAAILAKQAARTT